MAADEWFSSEESPVMSVFLDAFVTRLRLRAAAWGTDVRPSDTTFDASLDEAWCGIRVPGLSGDFTALWLECTEDDHGTPKLEGSWGSRDLVADDYGSDPIRDLTVCGAPITPGHWPILPRTGVNVTSGWTSAARSGSTVAGPVATPSAAYPTPDGVASRCGQCSSDRTVARRAFT